MFRRFLVRQLRSRRCYSTPTEPKKADIPAWHQRLGPVSNFFTWFHNAQTKRPYTVQLGTTAVIYLCGDLIAQDIGGEPYNGSRTLRMLVIGSGVAIPAYKWFLWLGNHFNYGSKWLSIFAKVCVQQAVFTPIFNIYFFGMQAILTGETARGVVARIKETLPPSFYNSFKLWPAATAFTYTYVVPQYRFMVSGLFAVCWQSYLSFLNRRAEKDKPVSTSTSTSTSKQKMLA